MQIRYNGPAEMRANQVFTAVLEVTLEDERLGPGGRLSIAARHVSDFGDAQTGDPEAENYLTIETSRPGARLELADSLGWSLGYRHPWNRGFDLLLREGELGAGDCVTLRLGGQVGWRGQSFVEERFCLRAGIQSAADAEWQVSEVLASPGWPIIGVEPAAVSVHVPDLNAEQAIATVCLKVSDTYGNPTGEGVSLDLILDDRRPVKQVTVSGGMAEVTAVALPADGGWHRLTAASRDGRFFARSNPFGPSLMPGYKLYWGEIHGQSALCDGTNSPEYLYRYARQAAGLDFASVTSHDMEMTPADWEEVKAATLAAHRPGSFVTLLGYEWSGRVPQGGDNNVYYLGDDGPLLYNGRIGAPSAWLPSGYHIDRTRTITDVMAEVGDLPTLIIPHSGGRACNLDLYDARYMPVIEIHSCHRCYEHVGQEALRRGLRVGFIGGSDDHRGGLGDSVPAARERFFSSRNGLVAVYARELTRAALWEAIFARRVYATNGTRTALSFSANGVPMGGELRAELGEEVRFEFRAVVDGYFDHAELIGDGQVLATFNGVQNQVFDFSNGYTLRAGPGPAAYYLKVFETGGGIAWSSPIWVVTSVARSLNG